MLEDIYTSEEHRRKANRDAVLLARTRYLEQVFPFVQSSEDRLAYAEPEIQRIVKECTEYVDADVEYVESHLRRSIQEDFEKIADEAVTKPKKQDLSFGNKDKENKERGFGGGPPSPPLKYDPAQVNPEPDEISDLSYRQGPLLEDDLREPDVVHDLNDETFSGENINNFACYRCGENSEKVVCSSCSKAIVTLGYGEGLNNAIIQPQQNTVNQQQQVCPLCFHVIPLGETIQAHYQQNHPGQTQPIFSTWVEAELKEACAHCGCDGDECDCSEDDPCSHKGCKFADKESAVKEAQDPFGPGDPADMSMAPQPQAPQMMPQPQEQEPVRVDQGLSRSPRERFDDIITDLANRAAARQFSQASDEEVQMIADHYQLDEGEVRSNLKVVAKFGEAVAVNGEVDGDANTEGMTEVEMEGMGGRVSGHEAEVPLDLALAKVSEDLNIEKDMVYTELKDSFGNQDLPQQYNTPIAGDHRFYLPENMVGAGMMQQQPLPPPSDGFPEQAPDDTRQNLQMQPSH